MASSFKSIDSDWPKRPLNTRDNNGQTAVFRAVQSYDVKKLFECLQRGDNPNIGDVKGITPLLLATWQCEASMVSRLLLSGGNPNLSNKEGITPIDAIVLGCEDISWRAERYLRLERPRTCEAVMEEQIEILNLLFQAKGRPNVTEDQLRKISSSFKEDQCHERVIKEIVITKMRENLSSILTELSLFPKALERIVTDYYYVEAAEVT